MQNEVINFFYHFRMNRLNVICALCELKRFLHQICNQFTKNKNVQREIFFSLCKKVNRRTLYNADYYKANSWLPHDFVS